MSAGVGYAAGGLMQGAEQGFQLSQQIQDSQATKTFGAAARVLAGGGQQGGQQQSSVPQLQQAQTQPAPTATPQQPPPAQAPPPTGMARSPMPQPPQQVPPVLAQQAPPPSITGQGAQPPVANAAGLPTKPPQPAPQGPQGTAALGQQAQQPPQQQSQSTALPMHPQAQGGGPWTLQGLTQAMLKANPNLSDRALGMALFKASPLLNQMGLQQYRDLGLMLREESLRNAEERTAIAREAEGRRERAAEEKPGQQARAEEIKSIRQTALTKYKEVMNNLNSTPEEKKAAEKALDEANAKADEMEKSGVSSDSGGEEHIIYNKEGKAMKYKGSGDPKDISNYEPLP